MSTPGLPIGGIKESEFVSGLWKFLPIGDLSQNQLGTGTRIKQKK
jgi:hypothetical protein